MSLTFNVITLFPDMITQALQHGVVGQALSRGQVGLQAVNPRAFTTDVHHAVDDRPYGGGDGMIMQVAPLQKAIESLGAKAGHRVLLSAHGRKWDDALARKWATQATNSAASTEPHITLVCGRYGGVDQRFINAFIDEEISIGDFILSGGEFAALGIIDSVVRLLPEVLGNAESIHAESFADGLLEAPQFTRPQEIWLRSGGTVAASSVAASTIATSAPAAASSASTAAASTLASDAAASLTVECHHAHNEQILRVPAVFLSGDHRRIHLAKRALALLLTQVRRPDLMTQLHRLELKNYARVLREFSLEELSTCGLSPEEVRPYLEY